MMTSRSALGVAVAALAAITFIGIVAFFVPGWVADERLPARHEYVADDRPRFVLAELYQDLSADVDAGLYDSEGHLADRWQKTTAGCFLRLPLARQHARTAYAPTATPPLPPTPIPTPTPNWVTVHTYEYEATIPQPTCTTQSGADGGDGSGDGGGGGGGGSAISCVLPDRLLTGRKVQLATPTGYVAPDPIPTATPLPAPTPVTISETEWRHWKGRPVGFDADGLAVVEASREYPIYGHLRVLIGSTSDQNQMRTLAQLPIASPHWQQNQAYIHLPDASGRLLLPADNLEVAYRALDLEIRIDGVANCEDLKLRWERPAGMVVTALTDQPYRDWGAADDEVSPPLLAALVEGSPPAAARTEALEVFKRTDDSDQRANRLVTSTVAGHISLPERCQGPQPRNPQGTPVPDTDCVRTDASQYIAFALRADLAPENGLSDMRETGSALNARGSFLPPSGQALVVEAIDGDQYQIYITANAWHPANAFAKEWTLQ